jgi:hypothetical protein
MNFKSVLLLLYVLKVPDAYSTIVEKLCIESLESVVSFYHALALKDKQVLGVYDWDEVINLDSGHKEVFRYREATTAATIHTMQDLKVATLILTSRLHGNSIKYPGRNRSEEVAELLEKSQTEIYSLPLRLSEYGAIDITSDTEVYFSNKENAIVKGSVVFGGSLIRYLKPLVLIYLIENKMLKQEPSDIFVIDDSEQHITSYEEHFEDRKENVYLFHFPLNKFCAPDYVKY